MVRSQEKFSYLVFSEERHLSVSTFYNAKSKFLLAVEPFTRLFYASFICTFRHSPCAGNWLMTAIAASYFYQVYYTNNHHQ